MTASLKTPSIGTIFCVPSRCGPLILRRAWRGLARSNRTNRCSEVRETSKNFVRFAACRTQLIPQSAHVVMLLAYCFRSVCPRLLLPGRQRALRIYLHISQRRTAPSPKARLSPQMQSTAPSRQQLLERDLRGSRCIVLMPWYRKFIKWIHV